MISFDFSAETERLIRIALEEDIRTGDITSEAIFKIGSEASATMTAKESGIIAGLLVAQKVFEIVDKRVIFTPLVTDGERVEVKDTILRVKGSVKSLLMAERTALNFLQRLSGVATQSAKYAGVCSEFGVKVLDTRKTTPGFRYLEKYAVRTGGADNHRVGLYDMYLIKDNHIKAAGSITTAIEACKLHRQNADKDLKIEVEVTNFDELREAIHNMPEIIMLDNFSVADVREAVKIVNGACKVEVSGGVTINTLREYAEAGIDYISSGALTHSVKSLDISMNIEFETRQNA